MLRPRKRRTLGENLAGRVTFIRCRFLCNKYQHPFAQSKWEDVCHKLLSNTATCKKDERWVEQVGDALMAQVLAYADKDRAEYKVRLLNKGGKENAAIPSELCSPES
jgi:hypothetical protein